MKQELDSSIIKSEQGSSVLIEQLNMGVLVDCHAPHDTVVLELKKLKHTLDKTKEQTDQFIDYQELFEVGVAFPFNGVGGGKLGVLHKAIAHGGVFGRWIALLRRVCVVTGLVCKPIILHKLAN